MLRWLGTIAGRVTDADTELPLAGAAIRASTPDALPIADTTTDVNGRYEMALPAGTYDVYASISGYEESSRRGVVVRWVDKVKVEVDFALARRQ
ncbi:MAG: carboxypeptidase-like regulatory domain-containing protein [Candidatus Bathyarchaeia archaeon]